MPRPRPQPPVEDSSCFGNGGEVSRKARYGKDAGRTVRWSGHCGHCIVSVRAIYTAEAPEENEATLPCHISTNGCELQRHLLGLTHWSIGVQWSIVPLSPCSLWHMGTSSRTHNPSGFSPRAQAQLCRAEDGQRYGGRRKPKSGLNS